MKPFTRPAYAEPAIPKPRLNIEPTDVSKLVLETLELVTPELEMLGIQLSLSVEPMAYGSIDQGAIQHVLLGALYMAASTIHLGGRISSRCSVTEKT